jgi:hypothetical protein
LDDIINDNGIIDLKAETARRQAKKEAEEAAKKAKEEAPEPNANRVYEVAMKSGATYQVSGVLMLTGSFFALGVPVGDGGSVDFNWAAPADSVDYVIALEDDELTED